MPRYDSIFAALADEVVDSIRKAFLSEVPEKVEKTYDMDADATTLTFNPHVYVRPSPGNQVTTTTYGSRSGRFIDLTVEVVIVAKTAKGDIAQIERIMKLAEEIDEHLYQNMRVAKVGGAWINSTMSAPYTTEELRSNGIVDVPLAVTFRIQG